jgi:hypothetical protein
MPMPPLPVPPSVEIAFGEVKRILLTQSLDFDPSPPGRVCVRSRGVPFAGIRPAFEYPPGTLPGVGLGAGGRIQ